MPVYRPSVGRWFPVNYDGLLRSTGGFLHPVSKPDRGRLTRGRFGTVCVGILRARDPWRSSRALRSMLRWSRSTQNRQAPYHVALLGRVDVNPTPNRYPRASSTFPNFVLLFGGRDARLERTLGHAMLNSFFFFRTSDLPWIYSTQNRSNFDAHFEGTGPEIWRQTNGRVDAFVAGAGEFHLSFPSLSLFTRRVSEWALMTTVPLDVVSGNVTPFPSSHPSNERSKFEFLPVRTNPLVP